MAPRLSTLRKDEIVTGIVERIEGWSTTAAKTNYAVIAARRGFAFIHNVVLFTDLMGHTAWTTEDHLERLRGKEGKEEIDLFAQLKLIYRRARLLKNDKRVETALLSANLRQLTAKALSSEMSKDDRILAIRLSSILVLMDEVDLETTLVGSDYNRPMTIFKQEYGYLRQVVKLGIPKDDKALIAQGQMGMNWYSQVMGITGRGKPNKSDTVDFNTSDMDTVMRQIWLSYELGSHLYSEVVMREIPILHLVCMMRKSGSKKMRRDTSVETLLMDVADAEVARRRGGTGTFHYGGGVFVHEPHRLGDVGTDPYFDVATLPRSCGDQMRHWEVQLDMAGSMPATAPVPPINYGRSAGALELSAAERKKQDEEDNVREQRRATFLARRRQYEENKRMTPITILDVEEEGLLKMAAKCLGAVRKYITTPQPPTPSPTTSEDESSTPEEGSASERAPGGSSDSSVRVLETDMRSLNPTPFDDTGAGMLGVAGVVMSVHPMDTNVTTWTHTLEFSSEEEWLTASRAAGGGSSSGMRNEYEASGSGTTSHSHAANDSINVCSSSESDGLMRNNGKGKQKSTTTTGMSGEESGSSSVGQKRTREQWEGNGERAQAKGNNRGGKRSSGKRKRKRRKGKKQKARSKKKHALKREGRHEINKEWEGRRLLEFTPAEVILNCERRNETARREALLDTLRAAAKELKGSKPQSTDAPAAQGSSGDVNLQ